MVTFKDALLSVRDYIGTGCLCIETGTQHDFDENNKDYFSTTNIVEYICKPKNGILYSFDIEQEFADLCNKKLIERGDGTDKHVKFVIGDSVEKLKECLHRIIKKEGKKGIDMVFLDSKEFDEYHMLKEINVIRPYLNKNNKCIIMCDDIHNPSSVKWKKAVPYIKEWVVKYWEVDTPTGLFIGMVD